MPESSMATPREHTPTPYGLPNYGGGVRCSCGVDYAIGQSHPDTPAGKPSKRKYRSLVDCWAAWRDHAFPGPEVEEEAPTCRFWTMIAPGIGGPCGWSEKDHVGADHPFQAARPAS